MPRWSATLRELWGQARPAKDKSEDDVAADPHVARRPAQRDDPGDAGQTGAETRSEGGR